MHLPKISYIKRTVLATVTVGLIAVIALGTLLYSKRATIATMDLASWGAFLAGAAGVFGVILVSAGFWLLKSVLESQEHAFGHLALALESQSEALRATHEPALESSTLLVTDDQRWHQERPADRIELTLINMGGDARDLKISLCGMDSLETGIKSLRDDFKEQRHPSLTQGNPPWISSWLHCHHDGGPADNRPQGFLVARYRDMHGIEHGLKFEVHWTRSADPPFSPTKHGILLRVSTSKGPIDPTANTYQDFGAGRSVEGRGMPEKT